MIEPGQTCASCGRRMPHPRKPTSPDSRPLSYRVPVDEFDAHKVVLAEASRHLGTTGRPHEVFWTYTYALAAVLQDESLKGAGQRSEIAV